MTHLKTLLAATALLAGTTGVGLAAESAAQAPAPTTDDCHQGKDFNCVERKSSTWRPIAIMHVDQWPVCFEYGALNELQRLGRTANKVLLEAGSNFLEIGRGKRLQLAYAQYAADHSCLFIDRGDRVRIEQERPGASCVRFFSISRGLTSTDCYWTFKQAPAPVQATAPVAPPTLSAASLSPLSVRLAEINLFAKQSLLTIARHCGGDATCRKQQTAAMQEIASKEKTVAKSLRNPTTYTTTVLENDSINACLVMWRASEDFASTVQCINDAAATEFAPRHAPTQTITPTPPPALARTIAPPQTIIAVRVKELNDFKWYTPDNSPACKRDENQCGGREEHVGRRTADDKCSTLIPKSDPRYRDDNEWCEAIWVSTENTNLTPYPLQFDVTCTASDHTGRVLGSGATNDERGDGYVPSAESREADALPPSGSSRRTWGRTSFVRLPKVEHDDVAHVECHAINVTRARESIYRSPDSSCPRGWTASDKHCFRDAKGIAAPPVQPAPVDPVPPTLTPPALAPAPPPQATAPPTIPASQLGPLSSRLAEINQAAVAIAANHR